MSILLTLQWNYSFGNYLALGKEKKVLAYSSKTQICFFLQLRLTNSIRKIPVPPDY